jgi:hypothetical protein
VDLYIYYRVRSTDFETFRTQALAMQHDLARDCGVAAALKRRPDEKDGLQTWMEVYADVDPAFEARLNQAVADSGLSGWIQGPRHTEQFLDVSLCA